VQHCAESASCIIQDDRSLHGSSIHNDYDDRNVESKSQEDSPVELGRPLEPQQRLCTLPHSPNRSHSEADKQLLCNEVEIDRQRNADQDKRIASEREGGYSDSEFEDEDENGQDEAPLAKMPDADDERKNVSGNAPMTSSISPSPSVEEVFEARDTRQTQQVSGSMQLISSVSHIKKDLSGNGSDSETDFEEDFEQDSVTDVPEKRIPESSHDEFSEFEAEEVAESEDGSSSDEEKQQDVAKNNKSYSSEESFEE
jgi:hypothetical protein